jgi:hypothetical protein
MSNVQPPQRLPRILLRVPPECRTIEAELGSARTQTMAETDKKSEILQVVETDGLYLLRIDYEEGDIASAIGHVFWSDGLGRKGEVLTQVLATNDPLRTLWGSPTQSLWVAGASGSVGTTAPVRWPPPTAGVDFLTLGDSPKWTATDLPRVRATGLRPNVTALWGTEDSDVYAGTYGGHIYRWDGINWAQVFEGPGGGEGTIRAFGGSMGDVYALGLDSTILHFDGTGWTRLQVPGPPNGHEGFNGLVQTPEGAVLISGSGESGRLLHGSAAGGLEEFGRYPIHLIDLVAFDERILFATGNGVAELFGRDVNMVKSTFMTSTASAGKGRVFFIEPAQERPCYIRYDPRIADLPWARIAY